MRACSASGVTRDRLEDQVAEIEGQARRATVSPTEAARLLGIKADSVRQNLRRGVLEGYQDQAGAWRVYLDAVQAAQAGERDHVTRQDRVQDAAGKVAELEAKVARLEGALGATVSERDHLREELRDQRAVFAQELAQAREAADAWLSYVATAGRALPAGPPAQEEGQQARRGILGRLLGR